jgi:hypothetical protein
MTSCQLAGSQRTAKHRRPRGGVGTLHYPLRVARVGPRRSRHHILGNSAHLGERLRGCKLL